MMKRFFIAAYILFGAALVGFVPDQPFAQIALPWPGPGNIGQGAGSQDCVGGLVTYANGQTIHTFTAVGSSDLICQTQKTNVSYLVVAGGGGGGGLSYSGGGGAGGMLTGTGATLNAGTSTVVVGAGGLGGASGLRGQNGANSALLTPGGAGAWSAVTPTYAYAQWSSGWQNYEHRSRWTTAAFAATAPVVGTQLRVTVGSNTASANSFATMYCGHAGAAPTSMNYDGGQAQIKFAGSASLTIPTTPVTSDPVNFSFNGSKDLICSWNISSSVGLLVTPATTGNNTYYSTLASGGPNAGNTTTTATGTVNDLIGGVTLIEAFVPGTVIAQTTGGGGGGQYSTLVNGIAGGSGGGGGYGATVVAAGIAGQGNAGGIGAGCGSGGGGAGAVGPNCTANNGSNGGAGLSSSISGTLTFYAAGGAGGAYTGVGGTGGSGIGGNGGNYSPATSCTPGKDGTGSGGGGVSGTGQCAGGSGIVIVSYQSGAPNVNCAGGTITTVGANTFHTFTTPGTYNLSCGSGKSVNYLIVAGGGGGGFVSSAASHGGGGGGGGFLQGTAAFIPGGPTTITVGAGGQGGTASCNSLAGGTSSVQGVGTAVGGGAGGCSNAVPAGGAKDGGSGGGSSYANTIGNGVAGQGFSGGLGSQATPAYGGGGGGGCGAAGGAGSGTVAGNGGVGCSSSISGTTVCYAGGGGGGALGANTSGTASCGGASAPTAGAGVNAAGNPGTPNTGGGGSSAIANSANEPGGQGGSGIVIVVYATNSTAQPPPCTPNTQGGGNDANVVGLWHLDDLTDKTLGGVGSGNHPISLQGGANISGAQSKFGGTSLQVVTAATSFAQLATGVTLVPANGDVTVEGWFYTPVALSSYWGAVGDDAASFYGFINSAATTSQLQIGGTAQNFTQGSSLWTPNVWHHWAWTRVGATGAGNVFVDGVPLTGSSGATTTGSIGTTSGNIKLGRSYSSSYVMPNNSFLDEVRVSNIIRYTTNFTPQTTAFCNPAATPSAYVGPGDVATGTPTAWWGVRAYNKAQATNAVVGTALPMVNARRASDSATCDIWPDYATGGLPNGKTVNCSAAANNNSTYANFCSATNCFATKLYDQSGALQCAGARCDVAQATAANQPQILTGAPCAGFAGQPYVACLGYTAAAMTLTGPTGPVLNGPFSVDTLAQRTGAVTTRGTFFVQGTTQTQFGYNNTANTVAMSNGGAAVTATASDNVVHSILGLFNGGSSSITVENTVTSGLSLATTATAGALNLGPGTSGNPFTGQFTEVGVWPSDISAQATTLCNNQYNFMYGPSFNCGQLPPICNPTGAGNLAATAPNGKFRYTMIVSGNLVCPSARQVRYCLVAAGGTGGGYYTSGGGGNGGGMQIGSGVTLGGGTNVVQVGVGPGNGATTAAQNTTVTGLPTATGATNNAGTGAGGGPQGQPGPSGNGSICPIDGNYYAGGGGGFGSGGVTVPGGLGGGGFGGYAGCNCSGGSGATNSGGGGGVGDSGAFGAGGAGAAGIVIIEEL